MDIPEIDAPDAEALLAAGSALFVDVRDPGSYAAARIPGAINPDDRTIAEFIASTDKQQKLVVYCYHGNSSLGGVAYFLEQGFQDVASLRGGFEHWREKHPIETPS
ncbi:MAG: rhodanese-like domain-containing protein [Planctomycetota bacterium]